MTDSFERRDSLRRSAPVKISPPEGPPIFARGVVSLRGIFLEGTAAIPENILNAFVGVEADLGGEKPFLAVCQIAPPPDDRPHAGHLLTWRTLDFEAERELARYLDEIAKQEA